MASFQYIPGPRSQTQALVEQFGTGLNQGITSLLDKKMNEIAQQKQRQTLIQELTPLLGPDMARAAAFSPEGIQREIVKRALLEPQERAYASALSSSLGGSTSTTSEPQSREIESEEGTRVPNLTGLSQKQATEVAKLHQKQRAEDKKLRAKEQLEAQKETLPLFKEINEEARSARNNNIRLSRIDELINSGNLSNPVFAAALKTLSKGIFGLGIDLTSLLTAESQEFDKIATDFLKEAKNTFGSRLTNFDVETYLKTIPSLVQSDAGKRRVLEELKVFNEASLLRQKAMNDIIRKNGGKRPVNLEEQIEEAVNPSLDVLAERFKRGYQGSDNKSGIYDFLRGSGNKRF